MKSKIFLCLLLIFTMFALAACGAGDSDGGTGMLNNGIDDIENDMDRMVDDIDGNRNDYGTGNPADGTSWKGSSIKNDGANDANRVSGGALANDIL